MSPKDLIAMIKCEEDHLFFTRYYFKDRAQTKFIVNWHHRLMADVVEDVIRGKLQNVLINVSPGGTKTELVVIALIARGLALNPRARFLHLSGSDTLAVLNSATARDIVASDAYQKFWPLKIRADEKSKKRWNVEVDGKKAGGVYATAIGGQVTGFRAGHMAEGFQGAIIIDDPVKPEDAFSKPVMDAANRALLTTVNSRKANPKTPIIVIMQRVGDSDPSDYILKGSIPGDWHHVKIPALIDDNYVAALPEKYRVLIPQDSERDELGRFSYWPYKEPLKDLLKLERGEGEDPKGNRISKHVFASQYAQSPKALGGNLIRGEHFVKYRVLPEKIKWRIIIGDTAQKTKEHNDFSVFGEFGLGSDNKLYILNWLRGRWEAPELQSRVISFWSAAKNRDTLRYGGLRNLYIEDKASGTDLIQRLKLPPYNIPVKPIERNKDKLTRVMDAQSYIEAGQACIPEDAPFTSELINECESFSGDMTHAHDDQVDVLVDGVFLMLASGNSIKVWEELGRLSRK